MIQVNPNSLANLKLPKPKKKYGHRYQVPVEKVDEIFKRLTDGETLREAAETVLSLKSAGVHGVVEKPGFSRAFVPPDVTAATAFLHWIPTMSTKPMKCSAQGMCRWR